MLTWIDALVTQMPEDWTCELDPKGDDDKVLEVPPELVKVYRAAMWAADRAHQINEDHHKVHDDAEDNFTEVEPDVCAASKESYILHKTRSSLLQEAVRQEIRDRLGLKQTDKIVLKQGGMVIEGPEPPDPLSDLLAAFGDRVRVLRV